MNDDEKIKRVLELETKAKKLYCEMVNWKYIIEMLSEEEQEEYRELTKEDFDY